MCVRTNHCVVALKMAQCFLLSKRRTQWLSWKKEKVNRSGKERRGRKNTGESLHLLKDCENTKYEEKDVFLNNIFLKKACNSLYNQSSAFQMLWCCRPWPEKISLRCVIGLY